MGDKQVYQKACKRFYTITFEYHRVSIRHLVCTNMFCVCDIDQVEITVRTDT